MNTIKKIVTNIIGKSKKGKDTDGDGVPDSKDCQPKNTMRQDPMSDRAAARIFRMQDNLRRRY